MPTQEQRNQIEQQLLREREEALEALSAFDRERSQTPEEAMGELTSYRFHMADIGTESMEREKQFLFASKEGERLYEIDEALRRLYAEPEGFGRCARCGREIEMERLLVVPATTLCAQHAREADDDEGAAPA